MSWRQPHAASLFHFCIVFFFVIYCFSCFFFNDTATTEIYTLSLHDALPISYIVTALKAYRAKSRSHPTMQAQASSLSDADMENIAAYFKTLGKH